MTYYLKSGNIFNVSSKEALDLHESLPIGTYTIGFNKETGRFFLSKIENFELKGKLYGNVTRHADRVLNTFAERSGSTGVMLSGTKGSGKTLLSKKIAIQGMEKGIPTIVINQPWCGEGFNAFIQQIDQPAIVIFDEFEKVYDREDQEKLLTLLDGVYPSKKLFMITCNDKWRVDQHMRNRPGRIYYMIDFEGLDQDFIRMYCNDNLLYKEHIDSICRIASLFDQFNFDMLKAMVEEINRYNETPHEVIKLLNTKPEFSSNVQYNVGLQINGIDIVPPELSDTTWSGNPLVGSVSIDYRVKTNDDDDEDAWFCAAFAPQDIKQVDPVTGKFVYVNSANERLVLSKVQKAEFNFAAF